MDRRALFFLGAAVVCLVLTPLTPDDLTPSVNLI